MNGDDEVASGEAHKFISVFAQVIAHVGYRERSLAIADLLDEGGVKQAAAI